MSKALKTVIAVGAAIAIPFAAPALASSLGLSTAIAGAVGSATAGSVIGGAITGAALNAATAAALGGDARQAALMGAIGGGIGGYTAAPGAAPTPTAPTGISAAGAPMSVPTQTVFDPLSGSFVQQAAPQMSYAPGAAPVMTAGGNLVSQVPGAPVAGLSGLAGAMSVPTTEQLSGLGLTPAQQSGLSVTPTQQQVQAAATTPSAGVATQPRTFTEAVQQIPSEIAGRFRDPKALADMTLRAAGTLAGSALAGSGLSSQEQELLNEQVNELRQLRETNQALFNQRLEQAQNLIGEAKYFDPEYFGLQRARRAQVAGARAKQAGLRGLPSERAAAEARRFDIATGRETGTAFDVGYQSGIQGRLGLMQAGLQAMPGPMQMSPYAGVRETLSEAERRRRERAGDIGSLFGSLTGAGQSRSRGPGGGG
jgi:hypothetical protein